MILSPRPKPDCPRVPTDSTHPRLWERPAEGAGTASHPVRRTRSRRPGRATFATGCRRSRSAAAGPGSRARSGLHGSRHDARADPRGSGGTAPGGNPGNRHRQPASRPSPGSSVLQGSVPEPSSPERRRPGDRLGRRTPRSGAVSRWQVPPGAGSGRGAALNRNQRLVGKRKIASGGVPRGPVVPGGMVYPGGTNRSIASIGRIGPQTSPRIRPLIPSPARSGRLRPWSRQGC